MSQEPTSEMTLAGDQGRAFDRAPALLAVLSPSGALLALSGRWEGRFGQPRSGLLGAPVMDQLSADTRAAMVIALDEVRRHASYEVDVAWRSAFGTTHALRWTLQWDAHRQKIDAHAQELESADARGGGLQARFERETGLNADELLKTLAQSPHEIFTVLNPDTSIRYESPAVERITGWRADELAGQPALDYIHDDDLANVLRILQSSLTMSQPQSEAIRYRWRHKTQGWVELETTGRLLYRGNMLHSIVLLSRELRAGIWRQREHSAPLARVPTPMAGLAAVSGANPSEEPILAALAASAPLGMLAFVHDEQTDQLTLCELNAAALHLTGHSREDASRWTPSSLSPALERACREVLTQGVPRVLGALAFPTQARAAKPYEPLVYLARPGVVGVLLAPIGASGHALDERSLLGQLALVEDVAQAEQARRLVLDLGHELRTPLNAIMGYSELMLEEGVQDSAALEADLRKIQLSARSLQAAMDNLLSLTRLRAGRETLALERVSLGALLELMRQSLEPLMDQHQVTLEVEQDATRAIYTDRVQLRQALQNVLSYLARHATPGSSIALSVSAARGQVAFDVIHTGSTAQMEELEGLLSDEPERWPRGRLRSIALGVALARRLAQQTSGELRMISRAADALHLRMTLGAHEAVHLVQTSEPITGEITEASVESSDERHASVLLVIDDDPSIHELTRRYLAKQHMHIASAFTGRQGLAMARQLCPTLILLDVVMPGMDGWTVLSQLRAEEDTAQIPVVVQSIVQDGELGHSLGANEVLSKPLERAKLLEVCERYHAPNRRVVLVMMQDSRATREALQRLLPRQRWQWVWAHPQTPWRELMRWHKPELVCWERAHEGASLEAMIEVCAGAPQPPYLLICGPHAAHAELQRLDTPWRAVEGLEEVSAAQLERVISHMNGD